MKRLDSNDGAAEAAASEPDRGEDGRIRPPGFSLDDSEPVTPRAQSEIIPAAFPDDVGTSAARGADSRASQVVPRGTLPSQPFESGEPAAPLRMVSVEGLTEPAAPAAEGLKQLAQAHGLTPEPAPSEAAAQPEGSDETGEAWVRESGIAPSGAVAPTLGSSRSGSSPSNGLARAAADHGAAESFDFGSTLDAFGPDDEDEATTVDAGAALTEEDHQALMVRIHSAMEQTLPIGTPPPGSFERIPGPFPGPSELVSPVSVGAVVAPEPVVAREPVITPGPGPLSPSEPLSYDTPAYGVQPLAPVAATGQAPLEPGPPASSRDRGSPFKQTMLIGVPQFAAQSAPAAEPLTPAEAVLASVVRVVGPPTQPPPRRSRRVGALSPSETPEPEPDHEAFVLTTPVGATEVARRTRPPSSAPNGAHAPLQFMSDVGRSSYPNVILPPPPQPGDFEPASAPVASAGPLQRPRSSPPGNASPPSRAMPLPPGAVSLPPGSVSYPPGSVPLPPGMGPRPAVSRPPPFSASSPALSASGLAIPSPPLRVTIEPPASLSRTRPPQLRTSPGRPSAPLLHELPTSDPFAGFVAPPPSFAQRWLVVVVVALAVVGLCALAAIAFGFLGKTGW